MYGQKVRLTPSVFCQNCPFSEVVHFWPKVRLTPWVFYKNWLFSDGVNFCFGLTKIV